MNRGRSDSELRALPEARALPPSLFPRPFYSLAGAVNELPGPKQGLALWWSQGALGSQNPHEVLRKERIPACSPQKHEASAKAPLETVSRPEVPTCRRPVRTHGTPVRVTDLVGALSHPGVPAPTGGCAGPAPWPPAPAVPGSAARSPAAPGQCRRVSAPNGHAALAPGTVRWGPDFPCRTEGSALPAAARQRFKSQRLRGRGRGGGALEGSALSGA